MADRGKLLDMYIAGIVDKFQPKNEEIIHSGVFLASSRDKKIEIADWDHNGISVISETVTKHMQSLCKNCEVKLGQGGSYTLVTDGTTSFELPKVRERVDEMLSEYKTSAQLLKIASLKYKKKS